MYCHLRQDGEVVVSNMTQVNDLMDEAIARYDLASRCRTGSLNHTKIMDSLDKDAQKPSSADVTSYITDGSFTSLSTKKKKAPCS